MFERFKIYLKDKKHHKEVKFYDRGYNYAAGFLLERGMEHIDEIESQCWNRTDPFDLGMQSAIDDFRQLIKNNKTVVVKEVVIEPTKPPKKVVNKPIRRVFNK